MPLNSPTRSVRTQPSSAVRRGIGPVEVWDAVCLAARGRTDVHCEGAEDVFVPGASSTRSAEELSAFAEELDRSVQITAGGARYRIAYGCHVEHNDSDGEMTTVTELRRDGRPVLISLTRIHFDIGNDESDAVTARETELSLVDADDPLGSIVYSLLGQP